MMRVMRFILEACNFVSKSLASFKVNHSLAKRQKILIDAELPLVILRSKIQFPAQIKHDVRGLRYLKIAILKNRGSEVTGLGLC